MRHCIAMRYRARASRATSRHHGVDLLGIWGTRARVRFPRRSSLALARPRRSRAHLHGGRRAVVAQHTPTTCIRELSKGIEKEQGITPFPSSLTRRAMSTWAPARGSGNSRNGSPPPRARAGVLAPLTDSSREDLVPSMSSGATRTSPADVGLAERKVESAGRAASTAPRREDSPEGAEQQPYSPEEGRQTVRKRSWLISEQARRLKQPRSPPGRDTLPGPRAQA